jgi:hypothetical protein
MKEIGRLCREPPGRPVTVVAVVSFEGLLKVTYFSCKWCVFLSSKVWSDLQVHFISDLYRLMKEIGRLCCEPPARLVLVDSVVSFLGLREMAYFLY